MDLRKKTVIKRRGYLEASFVTPKQITLKYYTSVINPRNKTTRKGKYTRSIYDSFSTKPPNS